MIRKMYSTTMEKMLMTQVGFVVKVQEAIEIDNKDVQHQAVEGVVDEGKHHDEGTVCHINV